MAKTRFKGKCGAYTELDSDAAAIVIKCPFCGKIHRLDKEEGGDE